MKRILLALALGFLLCGCVEIPPAADPAPPQPKGVELTLYLPDENAISFVETVVDVEEIGGDVIVEQLVAAGVLPEGTALLSISCSEDGTELKLDFNEEFRTALCSTGTSGERMICGSVVNTFLAAYGAQSVFFTAEGEIIESGHVVYDFNMTFFA